MKRLTSKLKESSYWLLGVFMLGALWYFASEKNWLGDTLLASPKEVCDNFKEAFEPNAEIEDKFYLYAADTIVWVGYCIHFRNCNRTFVGMAKNSK
jgi:ABC-type nitrate/sulfonate/bicarbonate transport system permease component